RSVIAMILVPLPRFVLPTPEPPLAPAEGGVDGAFDQIDPASLHQVLRQRLQNHFETSVSLPLLKTTMAGLIRRREDPAIAPRCAESRAHHSRLPAHPATVVPDHRDSLVRRIPAAESPIAHLFRSILLIGGKSARAILLCPPYSSQWQQLFISHHL